jgi:hypothetical protein
MGQYVVCQKFVNEHGDVYWKELAAGDKGYAEYIKGQCEKREPNDVFEIFRGVLYNEND